MSRLLKDEKIFLKFKKEFSFIFNDQILKREIQNHFDKKGAFASYILAFISFRFKKKRLIKTILSNKEVWLSFFTKLYKDQEIIKAYTKLDLNPCIEFDKVIKCFDCFDTIIEQLLFLLKQERIDLNLSNEEINKFLKHGLGYLLYDQIDFVIPYELKDILNDEKYESHLQMIIYNTRLFGYLKELILKYGLTEVNDFIVLILGMTKRHAQEK